MKKITLDSSKLLATLRFAFADAEREYGQLYNSNSGCQRCYATYWEIGVPDPQPDNPHYHRFGNHKPQCSGVAFVAQLRELIATLDDSPVVIDVIDVPSTSPRALKEAP